MLRRIRASDCRDPRDRVYGILGIVAFTGGPRGAVPLTVDYSISISPENVYKDFFLRYIDRYGTLRLLDEAGLWQGSQMRPTWIPDWRSHVLEHQLDLSLESATSHFVRAECKFPEEGTLRVLGRCAERVTTVCVLDPTKADQLDSGSWKEIAMQMLWNLGSVEADIAAERFARALCCILDPVKTPPNDVKSCKEEFKTYLAYLYREARKTSDDHSHVMKPPAEIISSSAATKLVQSVLYLRIRGAPLLYLSNRYVGIGARYAKAGDQIWAILGSRALILLREVENNKHQVVGPYFVHGFNWGEALLGPLPDHYTVVSRFEKTREGYSPYYLDTETGLASMWGPRISWEELEAHPPMVDFVPVTAPPGEPFRVRPDSEYLRRHSIDTQQIDLV